MTREIFLIPCSPCIVLKFTSYHNTNFTKEVKKCDKYLYVANLSAPLPGFQCPMICGALQNKMIF